MGEKKTEKKEDVKIFVTLTNGNQDITVRKDRIAPWLKNGYKEK